MLCSNFSMCWHLLISPLKRLKIQNRDCFCRHTFRTADQLDVLCRRVPELLEKHETALKAMFEGSMVSVINGETTDDGSNLVVNLPFAQLARSSLNASLQPVLVIFYHG